MKNHFRTFDSAVVVVPCIVEELCRYWQEKGFWVIVTTRVLHLLMLAFTIGVFAFLLCFLDWQGLHAECLKADTCDIAQTAIRNSPWRQGEPFKNTFNAVFLSLLSLYWAYSALVAAGEVRCVGRIAYM
jgi:autophagy-related protein 9